MRIYLVFMLIWSAAAPCLAADWPQWRGPRRDGVSREASGWDGSWPVRRIWSAQVGPGCTSPIVVANRVYVLGWKGPDGSAHQPRQGHDVLYCLHADTGEELWQAATPAPYHGRKRTGDEGQYGGPSGTPSFDPRTGWLFILSNDGQLRAHDPQAQGRPVWSLNLYERFEVPQRPSAGGGQRDFGYTGSPLLYEDQVIVEVGATQGTVMSFSATDGTVRWRSQYSGPAGHTSGPVLLEAKGQPALAVLSLRELVLLSLDADHAGQTLATYPWATDFGCNIPTPAVVENDLILTSSYNRQRTERLHFDGQTLRPLWTQRAHATISTPLVSGRLVCLLDNSLRACDVASGAVQWSARGFGLGNAIATADGRFIVYGRRDVALLDRDGQELARVKGVTAGTEYPHLALSHGRLLVKDREGNLVALRLPTAKAPLLAPEQAAPVTSAQPQTVPSIAPTPFVTADEKQAPNALPVYTSDEAGRTALIPRGAAQVMADGGLLLEGGALQLPKDIAAALLQSCQTSGQLSIEALIHPAAARQAGPARIISFSKDAYERNFTLGQEGDRLILRLRTTTTNANGMNPQLDLGPLTLEQPQHVVVSFQPGQVRCYVDGRLRMTSDAIGGELTNWEPFTLLLGNEANDPRPWRGRLRQVTLWDRALGAHEVAVRAGMARPPAADNP